jgi:glycosyltransferase involved in cell wall biosynthesis
VVTVHDLIAVHFGGDIPIWSRQYFGRWMPFSYRFADHIIAISEHTKRDIINLLDISPNKITVIYEAADAKFQPMSDKSLIESVKKKYKTGDKFILHIGTLNPRKNLEFLVDVYAEVVKKFPDYNLVLAGKKGWYYDDLFMKIKNLGLEKKVIVTGYLDEEDKVALYNAATVYAIPSLYEGFGLPLLEAMSCGLPVIASNTSSVPEIVGDGGLICDLKDQNDWIESFLKLLGSDGELKKYRASGLERAKIFSWKKTADLTQKVYEKVIQDAYHR